MALVLGELPLSWASHDGPASSSCDLHEPYCFVSASLFDSWECGIVAPCKGLRAFGSVDRLEGLRASSEAERHGAARRASLIRAERHGADLVQRELTHCSSLACMRQASIQRLLRTALSRKERRCRVFEASISDEETNTQQEC